VHLPEGAIDRSSITEVLDHDPGSDAAKAVQQQVRVVDFANMTFNRIRWEGAEFVPFASLEDRVQLGSTYVASCTTVPQALLQAELQHSQKLLRGLPIALANSKAAQKIAVESEDRDFLELGAIANEQHRIEKEISQQLTKANASQNSIETIISTAPKVSCYDASEVLAWKSKSPAATASKYTRQTRREEPRATRRELEPAART
jgi:hypothetical protein